jgi:hypothetical protein
VADSSSSRGSARLSGFSRPSSRKPKQTVQRESSVEDQVVKVLKAHRAKHIKANYAAHLIGEPDRVGCFRSRCPHCGAGTAVPFAIEIKRPGEDATPLQKLRLYEWAQAGARAGVAHSAEEAEAILGKED